MGYHRLGDHLKESLDIMKELTKEHNLEVRVFLSQAGEMVVKWYSSSAIEIKFSRTYREIPECSFLVGDLQLGNTILSS